MSERLTRLEEWAKLSDTRMGRVEDKLDRMTDLLGGLRTDVAKVVTREDLRNWSLWTIGTVVAAMLALVSIYLAASGSILTAFQTGVQQSQAAAPSAASQTVPQPIIIQLPASPAPQTLPLPTPAPPAQQAPPPPVPASPAQQVPPPPR